KDTLFLLSDINSIQANTELLKNTSVSDPQYKIIQKRLIEELREIDLFLPHIEAINILNTGGIVVASNNLDEIGVYKGIGNQ
ncbi:hypothetical protein, partial [Vibrio cincinnatiensis]